MMKKRWGIVATALFATLPLASSHAQDIRDQIKVTTGKAELVFPDTDAHAVAERVRDAVSQFAVTMDVNFRSLPAQLSPWPERPNIKQVFVQGAPLVEYQCPTAYAEFMKKPAPVRNKLLFLAEMTQFCFYQFEKGVKAYVIFHRAKKTESLTAGLFEGIAKTIQGSDEERITKQLQETLATIKAKDPNVLVARLEVPGKPLQEPDKVAVSALIPPAPATQPLPAQPMQFAHAPQGMPVAPSTPAMNAQQSKIEARKNLNAMGMSYHSQEQFMAAIKRKDDVAVQLFLDGDGIDPQAKNAAGKSPTEIAQQVGALDIVQLIQNKISQKSLPATPAAQTTQVQPPAAIAAPAVLLPVSSSAKPLSPETMAEIEAALDARKVPPEQRDAIRTQLVQQLQRLHQLAGQAN
ncbi:MAG: hypothetical protein K2Y10_11485 [Burkholderiaceae bacterium]|nr:hypothetical protein [Burkholderiaceae bacterium]